MATVDIPTYQKGFSHTETTHEVFSRLHASAISTQKAAMARISEDSPLRLDYDTGLTNQGEAYKLFLKPVGRRIFATQLMDTTTQDVNTEKPAPSEVTIYHSQLAVYGMRLVGPKLDLDETENIPDEEFEFGMRSLPSSMIAIGSIKKSMPFDPELPFSELPDAKKLIVARISAGIVSTAVYINSLANDTAKKLSPLILLAQRDSAINSATIE